MEQPVEKVTTLAMDLEHYCSNWGINPLATEAQRRLWPGDTLPRSALGTDDPHRLLLPEEDGLDGEPVGSCDAGRAARFFGSTDRLSPPERDLVRFGVFCHLGFLRTLHLVVKSQWEEFVLGQRGGDPRGHAPADELLTRFEEGALARLLDGFRLGLGGSPSADEIHALFEEHGQMASRLGFDPPRLSALVDQMVRSRVHSCGAASRELQAFEARQERELDLLRGAAGEEKREFWLKKSCWLTIQSELEDKLLLREEIRLRNFNVAMEWMALFGSAYVGLLEAQVLCHRLETRLAILKAEPSLSDEEIEERVKQGIAAELASVDEVKGEARHAATLARLHGLGGDTLHGDELDDYRVEARRLMREIWRLTHPDTLDGAFTERQRERLREYLEEVVKIRKSEAQMDVRALSVLSDILAKVKQLYEVMGIDLEPASVIKGDTLAEQTAWLESQIQNIESQIQELMAEIQAMSMDPDIREKQASMADEEAREATLLGLQDLKKSFEERNAALQAEHQRATQRRRTPVASA